MLNTVHPSLSVYSVGAKALWGPRYFLRIHRAPAANTFESCAVGENRATAVGENRATAVCVFQRPPGGALISNVRVSPP